MSRKQIITATVGATLGSACSAFAASGAREDNSDFVVWAFLAFCALIIIGQVFPLLRNMRNARKVQAPQHAKEKL